jgi:hypothetical protein
VVDHARTAAAADQQDRSTAAIRLTDTAQALSELLGEATGGRVTGDVAGVTLHQHATSLTHQADAWSGDESAVRACTLVTADHAALSTSAAHTATALGAADPEN